MIVTIVKQGYEVKQILFGSVTQQIKDWVKQLNDNPLIESEWTYDEQHVDKSIWELKEFLGIT
jgi:hypothetical protein